METFLSGPALAREYRDRTGKALTPEAIALAAAHGRSIMSHRPAKRVRCAIYARVSTDHGLEQDFNSLDAQQ